MHIGVIVEQMGKLFLLLLLGVFLAKLEILEAGVETSLGRVMVREGKFHQVKRMFAATGHEVLELKRTFFGPIALPEDLAEGAWRELTAEELLALRRAAEMAEN